MIKLIFDILVSILAWCLLLMPMIIIAVVIRLTSKGPAIHWSKRIGKNNRIFLMPKFRSMKLDTPQVATHLLGRGESYVTPIGRLLRAASLDELPQLWSVIKGDMSLVGPRPALFNQYDLIELRTQFLIHTLRPGVTGWAQINGRDELPVLIKVNFDREYLEKKSILFDLKILYRTVFKVLKSEGIKH